MYEMSALRLFIASVRHVVTYDGHCCFDCEFYPPLAGFAPSKTKTKKTRWPTDSGCVPGGIEAYQLFITRERTRSKVRNRRKNDYDWWWEDTRPVGLGAGLDYSNDSSPLGLRALARREYLR